MSTQQLILYECPATRSDRVKFLLAEMEIPFEKKTIHLRQSEHLSKDYLDINPYGCVPFFIDTAEDIKLIESGAICHYLGKKYKKNIYHPAENDIKAQTQYDELMYFLTSTFDPICYNLFFHTKGFSPEKRIQAIADENAKKFSRTVVYLLDKLAKNKYLLANQLSVPDFILAPTLLAVKEEVIKYPTLQNYIEGILNLRSMKLVREDVKQVS